jgi:hypothetical protein
VVYSRKPPGFKLSCTQLNRDCTPLTSVPQPLAGLLAFEAGRRRMDLGRYGLRDCHY